ncbi:hypothetical protein [Ruegeria intermedia]|uniref:hypothetical protein n=1 Tax=Ruegeria intermedia TaxID=996115 RepID=UPI00165F1A13|nr:hypothetical protein [Ruegeria intermedia]
MKYAPVPQISVDGNTRVFKRFPGYFFDAFFAMSRHIETHVARQCVLRSLVGLAELLR